MFRDFIRCLLPQRIGGLKPTLQPGSLILRFAVPSVSYRFEIPNVFEHQHPLYCFTLGHLTFLVLSPVLSFCDTHHEIIVPYYLRPGLFKGRRHQGFNFGLSGYYQITPWTVTALLVQEEKLLRIDVNDQRKSANSCLALTLGALAEGRILIRIQKEIVPSLLRYGVPFNHTLVGIKSKT